MKKIFLLLSISLGYWGLLQAQSLAIPMPDTLSGAAINLTMHQDSVPFFLGSFTRTLGFNQYPYLGPTLILHKGQNVSITVNNQIQDTTNVHWHGLHVAAVNDGGPHTMIMNGMSWNPTFPIMNNASTYWYHAHFHGKTAEHAIKGAAGLIIVKDSQESALALPRIYGVDDFPLIIQSAQFDSLNQPMPKGMQDSILLVNGVRANYGYNAHLNVPAQIVRLRLLNAAGERTFNFGFSNNFPFSIIGSDGGLLNNPVSTTRVRISPGERYEILVDLSSLQGQSLYLINYGTELPMGVQGGPTMPMPSGPSMDSPLNGTDYNVLELIVTAPTANPISNVPTTLANDVPLSQSQSNTTRQIVMSAANQMSMDGPFFFNNLLFDMGRIDYHIPLNNVEIWTLKNQTMVAHPFHIHDVQFYVLDRDGNLPPIHERGKKDIVLVEPNETVRFITKFETFADTLVPYVYHCHILMHEDDGMMGQFVINQNTTTVTDIQPNAGIKVYPNPLYTGNSLYIEAQENIKNVKVVNTLGQTIFNMDSDAQKVEVNMPQIKGIYLIFIETQLKHLATHKIMIE